MTQGIDTPDTGRIVVFNSDEDPEASFKFSRWRQANKIAGYYLNHIAEEEWVLHKARCNHVSMPPGSNLAKNEKVCGLRYEDVQQYIAQNGVAYHRCQTCKPR